MWRDLKSFCEKPIKFYYYYILSCWDQQNQNLVFLCLKPKTREARLQVASLVQMSNIWFSFFFSSYKKKKNAMKPWRQIEFVYFLLFGCAQWVWAHLWFSSEHAVPIEKVSTRPQKEKQKPCINIIFVFFLTLYIYHYNKSQSFTKRSLWPNLPSSLVIVVRLYFLSPNRFFETLKSAPLQPARLYCTVSRLLQLWTTSTCDGADSAAFLDVAGSESHAAAAPQENNHAGG